MGICHLDVTDEDGGRLAGINPDWWLVGQLAVNKLIAQIKRNETGEPAYSQITGVQGRWVEGCSIKPKACHAV